MGEPMHIKDDPDWTQYIKSSYNLRTKLSQQLHAVAFEKIRAGVKDGASGTINLRFHADLENGESITGINYLNGSNSTVGDFTIKGKWQASVNPATSVTNIFFNVEYTWNDIIDPNPQYDTDSMKDIIATGLSIGLKQKYWFSLSWKGMCNFSGKEDLGVINENSAHGYPFEVDAK